jgi:hypothetical protein
MFVFCGTSYLSQHMLINEDLSFTSQHIKIWPDFANGHISYLAKVEGVGLMTLIVNCTCVPATKKPLGPNVTTAKVLDPSQVDPGGRDPGLKKLAWRQYSENPFGGWITIWPRGPRSLEALIQTTRVLAAP